MLCWALVHTRLFWKGWAAATCMHDLKTAQSLQSNCHFNWFSVVCLLFLLEGMPSLVLLSDYFKTLEGWDVNRSCNLCSL